MVVILYPNKGTSRNVLPFTCVHSGIFFTTKPAARRVRIRGQRSRETCREIELMSLCENLIHSFLRTARHYSRRVSTYAFAG